MLLQRLREYSGRLKSGPPPMYQPTRIRWLIDLDSRGRLLGFTETTDESSKNRRGKEFLAPHIARSIGIAAKLLADRADYALGVTDAAADEGKRQRILQCHCCFLELVNECAQATGESSVRAVSNFLAQLDLNEVKLPENLTAGEVVTFRINSELPIGSPAVQVFWAEKQIIAGDSAQCLICGRHRPPAERHPVKVKGIPGGQTSGMALVSANKDAFESYGLKASLIAPICQECAESYATAANELIRSEANHLRIGPLIYLFWTKEEIGVSISRMFDDPQPGEVQELLSAARTARKGALETEIAPFYIAALSSSGGRVVVRDWLETSVYQVKQNLARYFALQQLIEPTGQPGCPLGIFKLSASTVFKVKDLPARVPQALLRVALNGGPLPSDLLYQAVRRAKAEQSVSYPRAALIKMVLASQSSELEETMNQLDLQSNDPAYLCGRLLAVLENIQRAALGRGINATIVDRYYGTASSAPGSVFGVLLKGSQDHLSKLRRSNEKTKERAHDALQRRLEGILAAMPASFPNVLTLREQGLFALGFYHQRAHERARIAEFKNSAKETEESE